ncbi:MAG: hypothetical protein KKH98_14390 [Spirochaetes bacterium]|nr:hypothetical protein [Spirochaetota bacterium]
MKIIKLITIVFMIAFVMMQAGLAQQELNTQLESKIKEAKQYLEEANKDQNAGEYDQAYANAEKAKALANEISELKAELAAKDQADSKIKEAKSLIQKAEGLQADKYAPDELASAKSSLLSAENSFGQSSFTEALTSGTDAVDYANNCLTKIEEAKKAEEEGKLTKPGETGPTGTDFTKSFQKGNYKIFTTYKVRLIPERRDCLWRIAEYKSIYGNPWKWPIIYKANKNQIKDPDLIYPGQRFDIPELDEKGNPVIFEKGTVEEKEVIETEVPVNEPPENENE